MENAGLQLKFFHLLRQRLSPHVSLADQLSSLLNVSEDSAYRRIRGEKQMGFDELDILCKHFRVSLDDLVELPSQTVIFQGDYIDPESFNFVTYLQSQENELRSILAAREKELTFLCKDIPVYHYYHFPEIAAFKYFSWQRTLYDFPALKGRKYSFQNIAPEVLQLGRRVADAYYRIPGTEILNTDNILTTLRQIEYFKDACLFASEDEIDKIYLALHQMVDHMEAMAQAGKKFLPGKDPGVSTGEYRLYVNEFYVGDNMLLVRAGSFRRAFLVHSGTNYISTDHTGFCDYQWAFVDGLIRRSSLISQTGEKDRGQFFLGIRERIRAFQENKVQTLSNQ